jgi:hypothetical protein
MLLGEAAAGEKTRGHPGGCDTQCQLAKRALLLPDAAALCYAPGARASRPSGQKVCRP